MEQHIIMPPEIRPETRPEAKSEARKHGEKGGYRQINKALNICAFDDYLESQTANLPSIPDVEQLTPRVLRVLGQKSR